MNSNHNQPFIAGNWKMHMTVAEAVDFVREFRQYEKDLINAQLVIIPPFTALDTVNKELKGSSVRLGAQNVYWEEKGAFTGEISPVMLKDIGCSYVVIGHSERRQYFNESNDSVNRKIRAALSSGLTPILCIGESQEEREQNKTISKIESQIAESLVDLKEDEVRKVIIAYEPIWAIGTGLTATPDQAEEVHRYIRDKLSQTYGNQLASYAIILYGGSVKPANTFSLLREKDINGALVGGASLNPKSFSEIAKEAIKAYKEKQ